MAIGNVELMHECSPKHLIAHGNSKIKIRQRNSGRSHAENTENVKK